MKEKVMWLILSFNIINHGKCDNMCVALNMVYFRTVSWLMSSRVVSDHLIQKPLSRQDSSIFTSNQHQVLVNEFNLN